MEQRSWCEMTRNNSPRLKHAPALPPVAILAGGLASRMRPLTEKLPKSLLPIAGKPFVFHQLEHLSGQGVERVVICLGHMGGQIAGAVGNGERFGLRVEYSQDGDAPLGTGGALAKAAELLGNEFFVLYGDSYLRCNYRAVYRCFVESSDKDGLMTVYRNDNMHDASNVLFANGAIVRYDKTRRTAEMRHIDYGLSLLRVGALSGMPAGIPFDLAELYGRLAENSRLAGFEVFDRFYEIGSKKGFAELDALLREEG